MNQYNTNNYPLQQETSQILSICIEVHRILGKGFLEIVYKDAIEYELRNRNIPYSREKQYVIEYKRIILPHKYFADFVVFDQIILEVKSQNGIADEQYKQIIFNAAASLATRYRPTMKSIQSWNKNQYFNCPVIIDNMMNLEMLNWVSQNGGDAKYQEIAVTHSNTSMKEFYRPDYSSFHVVDFDEKTGKVLRKTTHQGAANTSAWSRGQAWGLYGYITMYRATKNIAYLNHAKKIAAFYLNHPNLPADKVPYWDFDAGQQPIAKRDASAAAITASALMELAQYTTGAEKERYINDGVKMIQSLSNETYRAKEGENGGFLIKHCVGALTLNSEIDVPLVYADYYFLEALKRYKDWYLNN